MRNSGHQAVEEETGISTRLGSGFHTKPIAERCGSRLPHHIAGVGDPARGVALEKGVAHDQDVADREVQRGQGEE